MLNLFFLQPSTLITTILIVISIIVVSSQPSSLMPWKSRCLAMLIYVQDEEEAIRRNQKHSQDFDLLACHFGRGEKQRPSNMKLLGIHAPRQHHITQLQLELVAKEAELFPFEGVSLGAVSLLPWLPSPEECTSLFVGGIPPALSSSLVSRRSIIRDTMAIPAFTSLLTSEPISAIEELRENSFSVHPLVLFEIESLYFIDIELRRDFQVSEKDSEGPALSRFGEEDTLV